jgi:hypothetical protein
MTITTSNKAVAMALWEAMIASWNGNRTHEHLFAVIEWFLEQYPDKFHAIEKTAHAFNALVGINAIDPDDYWQTIDEYIPHP